METTLLQSVLALPMVIFSLSYVVWALLNPRRISILGMNAAVYGFQFCLGPILGLLALSPVILASSATVLLAFASIYAFWISALATAYIVKSPLESVLVIDKRGAQRSRGIFTNMAKVSSSIKLTPLVLAYLVILAIRIYVHFAYGMVLSGTLSITQGLAIPYMARVLYEIASPLGPALAFANIILLKTRRNSPASIVLVSMVAIEFLFGFTQGRRVLMMLAAFVVLGVLTIRSRIKAKHAIMILFVSLFLWKLIFPLFFYTRLEWQSNRDGTVTEWLTAGFKKLSDSSAGGEFHENVADRLNAISFSYTVAEMLTEGYPMMDGEILENTALAVIPRLFFPGKLEIVVEPDTLVNEHFGLGNIDQASNLPAFSLADFGVPGGMLYGALLALSIRLIELMLRWLFRNTRFLAVGAVGSIGIEIMFSTDTTPTSFVNDIRGVFLILLLGVFFKYALRGGRAVFTGPLYWSLVKGIPPTARLRMPLPRIMPSSQRK